MASYYPSFSCMSGMSEAVKELSTAFVKLSFGRVLPLVSRYIPRMGGVNGIFRSGERW